MRTHATTTQQSDLLPTPANCHHVLRLRGDRFAAIRDFFNRLNQDQHHFVNSNDICTPLECVKEMVDSIPSAFWRRRNIKVLDSCCGNGNFHSYIATKTKLANLYFNEINTKRIKNLTSYFGTDINLTRQDFLTYAERECFDLVVANPPYAHFNGTQRTSKNHNVARAFIHKSLAVTKKGGLLLLIVPNNWMSFADRNTLPQNLSQYQFIHLDIHGAKRWFPKVGSSFTWFLLQKVANTRPFTIANHYVIKDTQQAILDKGVNFIPLYYSSEVRNILNKVVNNDNPKYKIETTSFLHRHTKKPLLRPRPTTTFRHKIIHTPSQVVWSSIPHKYQQGYKVFISLTNQYATFIDACGMTQSIAFVRCTSLAQAQQIKRELDHPIFKCINNLTRYGNFNNIRVLQNLSRLGSFKLSKNELAFVHEFNRNYGKKEK